MADRKPITAESVQSCGGLNHGGAGHECLSLVAVSHADTEPIEVGWYAYSGGAQTMIFHLRETGQWSAHFANGMAADCGWGYIEQALGVWDLVRLSPGLPSGGEERG